MRWLLACLLTGCQVFFPLEGGIDPSSLGSCSGIGEVIPLDLIADTYVDGTDTSHGRDSGLVLDNSSSVLLRFSIGPNRFDDLRFTVRFEGAANADACGPGCGACGPTVSAGEHVLLTRPDWDEDAATALHRTASASWSQSGPTGADVIELPGPQSTSQGRSLTVEFDGGPADPSWPTGQVSLMFQLPGTPGTSKTVVASREDGCATGQPPPRATVTCLPHVLCGNGVVDTFAGENCDDGNRESGDGCSSFCFDEALCGNGMRDPGEQCDDGNTDDTDGCTSRCQFM